MTSQTGESPADILRSACRSDALQRLRPLLQAIPALQQVLGPPFQIRLVIDTSVVISDLLFLAGKRRNAAARTNLQELIASGTVEAFAPDILVAEVERRLPSVAAERRLPVERLRVHWVSYRQLITLVPASRLPPLHEPSAAALQHRDATDLPFLNASDAVGAAGVVTTDGDFEVTGAKIDRAILVDLRTFARSASVVLHLSLGGLVVTMPVVACLVAIGKWLNRLPPLVKIALVVGGIVYLSDRNRRARLGEALRPVATGLHKATSAAAPVFFDARLESTAALGRVRVRLPRATLSGAAPVEQVPRSSLTRQPTAAKAVGAGRRRARAKPR